MKYFVHLVITFISVLTNGKDEKSRHLECKACFYLGQQLANRISTAHLTAKKKVS